MYTGDTCQICLAIDCPFRLFCDDDATTQTEKTFWPDWEVDAA